MSKASTSRVTSASVQSSFSATIRSKRWRYSATVFDMISNRQCCFDSK
jgi:hypothetical protein